MRIAPGGHAGELHTVLDDVVNLAIAEILGCGSAQVGHSRIEIQPHLRLPAAIDSMTNRAMGKKPFSALLQSIRSRRNRVFLVPFASGNGKTSHGSGQDGLPSRRHRGSAEASPDQEEAAGRY